MAAGLRSDGRARIGPPPRRSLAIRVPACRCVAVPTYPRRGGPGDRSHVV